MVKKIILLTVLIFSSCDFNKRTREETIEEYEIVKDFFNIYESNPSNAVENIFSSSKWLEISINKSQKDSLITQLQEIVSLLGEYKGHEVVKQVNFGKSYKIISSIAKYERQSIRFVFLLYKPDELWQIQNFTYDLNLEDELMNNVNVSFDF